MLPNLKKSSGYGFYKALKSLGHEVYWFDDVETNFNFENSIIITQSNCIKNR